MSLEKRIDDLIEIYYEPKRDNDSWLIKPLNYIRIEGRKLEHEVEQLRAENARLTEIASEKATRMDELYLALSEYVEYQDDICYWKAVKVLNKNNQDGEL